MSGVTGSSLIGVAIACAGNVLISLALTVQKLAHRQIAEEHRSTRPDHEPEGSDGGRTEHRRFKQKPNGHNPSNDDLEILLEADGLDADPRPVVPVVLLASTDGTVGASMDGKGDQAIGALRHPRTFQLNGVDGPTGQIVSHRSSGSRPDSSEDDGDTQEGPSEAAYLKSKLWWIGLAMISIGEGGNFLSYAFAPASVVAPLGTVALVANCIFAPLILQERFRPRELIGMGLAILGAVTVVYASNYTNPRLNPAELLSALSQPPFLTYTALNLLLLLLLIPLSRSMAWGGRFPAIDIGICAIFGGYTVLSTKALASLLSTIFLAAFEYPVSWGLVLVLVGTSVAQVRWLNMALAKFESKEVIPTQFVFFSLAAIIGSAVLYQEFRDVTLSRFINFAFGVSTTFLGVHLLTSLHQSRTPDASPTSTPGSPSRSSSPTPSPSARNTTTIRALQPSASSAFRTPTTTPGPAQSRSFRTSERSPLLIPSASALSTPSAALTTPGPISPRQLQALSPSLRGFRLIKRSSTGEISTLGINPQAGILLLGASPGASSGPRRGRERVRDGERERSRGPSRIRTDGAGRGREREQDRPGEQGRSEREVPGIESGQGERATRGSIRTSSRPSSPESAIHPR